MNPLPSNPENARNSSGVYAVVPAAGRSRRMGSDKLLLDVGGQPMILGILRQLIESDVKGVVLVTQDTIAEFVDSQHFERAFIAINDDPETEMIDSIRIGLKDWNSRQMLQDWDGILVTPADTVGVNSADFNACIAAFRASPDRIVVATHGGRQGHPIIIPYSLGAEILSDECDAGLRSLLSIHASRVRRVELESPAVLRNVNTPKDYEQLG